MVGMSGSAAERVAEGNCKGAQFARPDVLNQMSYWSKTCPPSRSGMASAGIGGATHVFGELFMMMAGVNLLHVPYRGNFKR
jgi:hypothetical protein